jgi:hypothetical protein
MEGMNYDGNKMKMIFRKMKLKKKRSNGYIFYKKIKITLKKLMNIIRIRESIILIYFTLLVLKVRDGRD